MTLKETFVTQANAYDPIYQGVFSVATNFGEQQQEMAEALTQQTDSPQKETVIFNIDRLHRVSNVAQFQSEAMCEFIRSFVGPVAAQFAEDEMKEETIVPAFLFLHSRLTLLHDQLDFFFGNFAEKDLHKAFKDVKGAVSEMAFSKDEEESAVSSFLDVLEARVVGYIHCNEETHDWMHGVFDIIAKELAARGIEGLPIPEH
ncbi:MAG: hypothetical protein LBI43_01025 [Streptococcaceae bacterium]|jgi:hypothetical protein|nr:hypothetical protein [Streptococcaceae bacterium]